MSQNVSLDEVLMAVADVSPSITEFQVFLNMANESLLHPLDEERLTTAIRSLKTCGVKFDVQRLDDLLRSVFQLTVAEQVMTRLQKAGLVK